MPAVADIVMWNRKSTARTRSDELATYVGPANRARGHLLAMANRLHRRTCWTRLGRSLFAMALAWLFTATGMIVGPVAHADDTQAVDLGGLLISEQQVGSGGFSFRQIENKPWNISAMSRALRTRSAWEAAFVSSDERVVLEMKLVEFTNNHWATTRMRVDAGGKTADLTPPGFPKGAILVAKDDGSGQFSADAVKGRIQVLARLIPRSGEVIEKSAVDEVLGHVLTEQLNHLPDTPDLESNTVDYTRVLLIGLNLAAIPFMALWIAAWSTFRDIGTLERFFPARTRPRKTKFEDLTPVVRAVRVQAFRRTCALFIAATVLGVLLFAVQYLVKLSVLAELAIIPLGLALAIALHVVLTSKNDGDLPFTEQSRLPLIIGTVGAMAVLYLAVLMLNAPIAFIGLINLNFWPIYLLMLPIYFALGVRALKATARPLRYARRLVARDVAETLASDPRQEILLLRSFQDDALIVRMHRTTRHNPIELAAAQPFERFEELLAWSLWRFGPVVAIGQPGTEDCLRPLGAAREFYSDEDWQRGARTRIRRSSLVVFVVGRSPGLWWEIQNVCRLRCLHKCLFIIPPVGLDEVHKRLLVLGAALGLAPATLQVTDVRGRRLIGVYFDDSGKPLQLGVNGRDDLAYQTMLIEVGSRIIGREALASDGSPMKSLEPTPDIARYLEKFDPYRAGSEEPRMLWGVAFICRMLTGRRITVIDDA